MCVAPNEKSAPVGYTAVGGRPLTASRRSRSAPPTTATAPRLPSWSWKPVSCRCDQQISHTSRCVVQVQPDVEALDRRVADVPLPQVGPGGELADERLELGPGRLATQVALRQPRIELDVGGDRLVGQSGVAVERCHQVTSSTVTATRWTELLA